MKHKPSLIERLAETLHLIPNLHGETGDELPPIMEPGNLKDYPPPEQMGRLDRVRGDKRPAAGKEELHDRSHHLL